MKKLITNTLLQVLALFSSVASLGVQPAQAEPHTPISPVLTISATPLPSGLRGRAYLAQLRADGGTPGYVWRVTSGHLPSGLSLDSSKGVITGVPATAAETHFAVAVTDQGKPIQSRSEEFFISVAAPLTTSSLTLASASVGKPYLEALTAKGGTLPHMWSVQYGALPAGMKFSEAGLLYGIPTQSGSFNFVVRVMDGTESVTASIILNVVGPLSINAVTLNPGVQSKNYSTVLQAQGGVPAYTWTVASGTLPPGLTLAAATGVLAGIPQASGAYRFTVRASDQAKPAASATTNLSVSIETPLTIATPALAAAVSGTAYAAQVTAAGGTPAYTWSLKSGSLPNGIVLNASTGVISGTPSVSGVFAFTLGVTDSGTLVQQQVLASTLVVAPAVQATGPGTTWYVRADGGSRYSANMTTGQCDGKADAPYGGIGVNQHCAFGDYRYLYDDQSYSQHTWAISGGDTVILDNTKQWRVGFEQGVNPNDVWCRGANGPFSCFNPTIPAGTATQHTRILGRNYASCKVGNAADPTQMTQLFGGYGAGAVLNLTGAQFVDVECLELTRHSQCIRHGSPSYPSGCSSSFPLDDYDSEGVITDTSTHDLLLQDMWIHGHTDRGIIGPIGGTVTALRTTISYNAMAGWDFDDGKATPIVNGQWNFLYSTIEWNGCNQEYPITHANPAISCYGQSSGGYGDGVGTPAGTGLNANVDHSTFRYNTQDGLDLGHVDTGGPYTLNISNSLFYGNNGGEYKWGANFTTATVINNLAVSNCYRMSAPMAGTPDTYNANLGDFCRAQDAVSFNFIHNGTLLMANNTVVSYAPTTFDIGCWDNNCGNSVFTFTNNLVLGYTNSATFNSGGQEGGPGGFYFQQPIGNVQRSNNLFYGIRNLQCPTTGTAEQCADPQFVNQPVFVDETSLDNFNFNLSPGSPARGAGVQVPSVPTDFAGTKRANPPSIGAIE